MSRQYSASAKEWLDINIRNGFITCYSKSDVELEPYPFDHGGYAVVYKARMVQLVVTKTLLSRSYEDDTELQEKFAKEVNFDYICDCCYLCLHYNYANLYLQTVILSCQIIAGRVTIQMLLNF